jgi:uncharacterized protein (TIGR03437 family)
VATLGLVVPRAGSAQTPANISIVQGQGQLRCGNCFAGSGIFAKTFNSLGVKVTDASGNPVVTTVYWVLQSGNGFLASTQTQTASDGTSFDAFTANLSSVAFGTLFNPYTQNVIVACTSDATCSTGPTVTFYETQAYGNEQQFSLITAQLLSPEPGTKYTGTAGSIGSPPVQARVFVVPNVAVRLRSDQDRTTGPQVSCVTGANADPGSVLTDATGTASCTPLFGPTPGSGRFFVDIGGQAEQDSGPDFFFTFPGNTFPFTVNPGTPGAIQILSGNAQSANAGATVSQLLIAKVVDVSGNNTLAGQNVVWTVTPAGSAVLSNPSSTSDSSGQVSTNVTFASSANGTVQVKAALASNPNIATTFTLTAVPNVTITGLSKITGDNQSAIVNTAFGTPVSVQLSTSNGQGLSNIPVQFTVNGPGILSASRVNTDANGRAQVNVTAGSTAGSVTVTAAAGGQVVSFNLTVAPPGPQITANSFYNGASFVQGAVAPCSIATIIAPGIAANVQGVVTSGLFGPLSYLVANDRVTVNNIPAPIFNVANINGQQQITFEVPCDVTPGSNVLVTVNTAGGGSASTTITVAPASVGLFTNTDSDGVVRVVAVKQDGTFVRPQTASDPAGNPARRGEIVRVYATGLGAVTPTVNTNSFGQYGIDSVVQAQLVAGMTNQAGQGVGIRVVSARMSPALIGVYEVQVLIPNDAATGNNVTFSLAATPQGSATSNSQATKMVVQ